MDTIIYTISKFLDLIPWFEWPWQYSSDSETFQTNL